MSVPINGGQPQPQQPDLSQTQQSKYLDAERENRLAKVQAEIANRGTMAADPMPAAPSPPPVVLMSLKEAVEGLGKKEEPASKKTSEESTTPTDASEGFAKLGEALQKLEASASQVKNQSAIGKFLSNLWATMKANPGKTALWALVVVAAVALAVFTAGVGLGVVAPLLAKVGIPKLLSQLILGTAILGSTAGLVKAGSALKNADCHTPPKAVDTKGIDLTGIVNRLNQKIDGANDDALSQLTSMTRTFIDEAVDNIPVLDKVKDERIKAGLKVKMSNLETPTNVADRKQHLKEILADVANFYKRQADAGATTSAAAAAAKRSNGENPKKEFVDEVQFNIASQTITNEVLAGLPDGYQTDFEELEILGTQHKPRSLSGTQSPAAEARPLTQVELDEQQKIQNRLDKVKKIRQETQETT